jgi:hypothetical protein
MAESTPLDTRALPTLEAVCPECGGAGSFKDPDGQTDCWNFRGVGTIPTEDGKKIIRLIQSNFRRLLIDSGAA